MKNHLLSFAFVVFLVFPTSSMAEWQPAKGPLMTRWAGEVSPDNVLPEYPRPQMVRPKWKNLNGLWDYCIQPRKENKPEKWTGKILVPFAAESALSGVMKPVGETNRLWYRRTFKIPADWSGKRVLLHFGAVDWKANVWLNGKKLGTHCGGYDPFSFDITDALKPNAEQTLIVAVWDATDTGTQPRGKQVKIPKGVWYTAVTGIWQTVWLEPVAAASVHSVEPVPDIDNGRVSINVKTDGSQAGDLLRLVASTDGKTIAKAEAKVVGGEALTLIIPNARLWSPEDPFLYDLSVELFRDGKVLDRVDSYFGMRKISLGKDDKGLTRIMLNNRFLFQYGPLDQGMWPDGLYTAPTDDALRYDLEVLKKLGCNMLRKHVKIEPQRLYYWCDKLGLLVWQDMPLGDRHISRNYPDIKRTPQSAATYERELKAMIDAFRVHPCIIMWVLFNEGSGQFDTVRITELAKQYDSTRLINSASGWCDRGVGDLSDAHSYPDATMPTPEENRAIVSGEFGGLGLPVAEHLWWNKRNWGYRQFKSLDELQKAYLSLLESLHPLIDKGLSAAVYTQTSDIEGEINGMMTYDRKVIKLDSDQIRKANRQLSQ